MTKLKVGIVGLNRGAEFIPYFVNSDRAQITALCDIRRDRLEAAAAQCPGAACFEDFAAFLAADIDAVVICTPLAAHEEMTLQALAAGKHILCEVGAADSVEGCRKVRSAVKASDRKYMTAENHVYFHYFEKWKEYLDSGVIGRVHYAESEFIQDLREGFTDPSQWRASCTPIALCAHCLGPILSLLGDDCVVKVTAAGNGSRKGLDMPGGADMQVAFFETKQGRLIKVARSQVQSRAPELIAYELLCTKGSLESDRYTGDGMGRRYIVGVDYPLGNTVPIACFQADPDAPHWARGKYGTADYRTVEAFLDAVLEDKEPQLNVDFALKITLPGLVAAQACSQGHVWLDVPEI